MLYDHVEYDGHEQVTFVADASTGLRAIVAIHRRRGGSAGGGVRFRPYASDAEALTDVLRLSTAMTHKMVLADLPVGGAKSVIIGDPRSDKSPELLHAFGRYVDSLGGAYRCGPDVGTDEHDMDTLAEVTPYVAGRSSGAGSTAIPTAEGVFSAIRAVASAVFGTPDLEQRTIAVQGVGGVGADLTRRLVAAGASVTVADPDDAAVATVAAAHRVAVGDPATILAADVDIVSPNAIGGVLDPAAIGALRARAVCGSANNQLASPECGRLLADRGIAWVPDYVASAGGAIAGVCELGLITPSGRDARLSGIGDTATGIVERALATGRSADDIARQLAADRLAGTPATAHMP